MIKIGQYNTLTILRDTSVGLYLGDEEGEDVLLPNKYVPEEFEIDDEITVFVYLDYDERKVATNIKPLIELDSFALLEVTAVADVGAFLDWGMEKNLMVPFKEQRQKMEVGRWYVVRMGIDEKTDRLYASNKIENWLSNDPLTVEENDEVNILVYRETEIGFSVIINNIHKGLIFKNEIFKEINIGDQMKAYVKKIREENKIDISLQPLGYENVIDTNSAAVYKAIQDNGGFLNMTDKSSPDEISMRFGMSKKSFKKAIGDLYRKRKIILEKDGLRLS